MKVKDIKSILRSAFSQVLYVYIFDNSKMEYIANGPAEYIVRNFGDVVIDRIATDGMEGIVLITKGDVENV